MTTNESGERDTVARPTLVTISVVLWVLSAITYLGVSTIVMSNHSAQVDQQMVGLPKTVTRDQVSTVLTIAEFAALIIGVLAAAGVYLLMKANRRARVLLIVLVFLQLFCLLLFNLDGPGALFGVAGLILLFLPASNRYFTWIKQG
ncbi:hypothetical protein [Kutzneria chonburiensis]|uniref:Uncharacterized protein n=1 Tax=Kutzneria chonburiensis TaxID=1483604 RepID=A0ABV6MWI6_9PSEU|nr:hypothetical protein [Kutzneria chonburiensis]